MQNDRNDETARRLLGHPIRKDREPKTGAAEVARVLADAGIEPGEPIEREPVHEPIHTTPALMREDTCFFCGEMSNGPVCDDCEAKNQNQNERIEREKVAEVQAARLEIFRERVGGYFDTDPDLLPDFAARRAARDYMIGGKRSITFFGPGRTGKTRSAVWLGRREHDAGKWVEFRQCGELRQEIAEHARNGTLSKGSRPLYACDVLILDDFGNHEFTRTACEFFLALLEKRTIQGRRNFVTGQYDGPQLRELIKPLQMAEAIMRRIGREFATTVNTQSGQIIQ